MVPQLGEWQQRWAEVGRLEIYFEVWQITAWLYNGIDLQNSWEP